MIKHWKIYPFALLLLVISCFPQQDPDRMSTTSTGWSWFLGINEAGIDNIVQNEGLRPINIKGTGSSTFDTVLVSNTGDYARIGLWGVNQQEDQIFNFLTENNGRITDLEVYSAASIIHFFTYCMVKNEGPAFKNWAWAYDVTFSEIDTFLNNSEMRLTDLEVYSHNFQTRYAYVAIKNVGPDKMGWWWYPDVTPAQVNALLIENKARLLDLERLPNGNMAVIMIADYGKNWWWCTGVTAERAGELATCTASRFIDCEPYEVNNQIHYAFISLDNALTAETRRLRDLIYNAYDNPDFNHPGCYGKAIRGFLVKEVNGEVLAELAANKRFQPLSVLKILPYLHAMIDIDKGAITMNTIVDWVEAIIDDPLTTDLNEHLDQSCLEPGTPGTQHNRARLLHALPTMMWESHNRTLDAVLDLFGPDNITARAQNELLMTQTEMHYGCPQGQGIKTWEENRTTLYDLAILFEGVHNLEFVNDSTLFFDNMINHSQSDPANTYTSGITGRVGGPATVEFLRDIVIREAGPSVNVDDFLDGIIIRKKGGGGGPSCDEIGYSDIRHVTLPFKDTNGRIYTKSFIMGWYVYKLKCPSLCPDYDKTDSTCQTIWDPERNDLSTFAKEIHALPIRMALETW